MSAQKNSITLFFMTQTIHIGNEIRKHLTDHQRSVAWLAAQLHHDPSNLRKLLKNPYMPTDLLFRISTILEKDFFVGFSALLAENVATGKICPKCG